MAGTFITVEGLDGAGKTLVVKSIKRKFGAETTCEPSEFWTGKQVRKALRNDTPAFTDFFLFMADRHYHIEEFIKPEVENGGVVVSDRFSDSTLAYQPVQLKGEIHPSPQQWMERVMDPWNLTPDLTIYLDVSVDTALERCDGEEKYEKREMLEEVKANYDDLTKRFSDRFEVVDAEQSKKAVREEVLSIVGNELNG